MGKENWAIKTHRKLIMNRRVSTLVTAIEGLLPESSRSLLDVGCGTGEVAHGLISHKSYLRVHGVDILERKTTKIPVTTYNGEIIPFSDNSFDIVMLVDVLHHCTDQHKTLDECIRVSKGHLLIKDHIANTKYSHLALRLMDWVGNRAHGVSMTYRYNSRQEWDSMLEKHDLKIENEIKDLPLYPWPFSIFFGGSLHCLWLITRKAENQNPRLQATTLTSL